MKQERKFPIAIISKKAENTLRGGHVWVYDTEVRELKGDITNGCIVDVVSEKGGRFRTVVPPSLPYTDHFAVNEYEASQITGVELTRNGKLLPENLPDALRILRKMGVKKRIVIHTPLLAAGLDENDRLVYAPALKLPEGYIRGSVGAGDAFTAGFLYETMRGASLETALRTANAVAACSLCAAGATEGVPTLAEALALYERFPVHEIG